MPKSPIRDFVCLQGNYWHISCIAGVVELAKPSVSKYGDSTPKTHVTILDKSKVSYYEKVYLTARQAGKLVKLLGERAVVLDDADTEGTTTV